VGTQGNGLSSLPFGSSAGLSGSLASGSGGGVLGFGNQALDPATGQPLIEAAGLPAALNPLPAGTRLSSDSVRLGLGWQVGERLTLGGEVEHEVARRRTPPLAVGADWRLTDWARLYTRWEQQSGWTTCKVSAPPTRARRRWCSASSGQPLADTQVFSEYRLRDAVSGADLQLASGLRRQWTVAEGLGLQRRAGTHPGPARQRRHRHRGHAGAGLDRRPAVARQHARGGGGARPTWTVPPHVDERFDTTLWTGDAGTQARPRLDAAGASPPAAHRLPQPRRRAAEPHGGRPGLARHRHQPRQRAGQAGIQARSDASNADTSAR
jgi:hypothetical protein